MIIDFKKYSSIRIGEKFKVELLDKISDFDGFLIGGANNLLISPEPKKIGILSQAFNFIELLDQNKDFMYLRIGAKTSSKKMYDFAKVNNLYGFEILSKIPGTLGGLLKMNAGLKGECISENLIKITTSKGEILKENINFTYRSCSLNLPFFSAEFKLNFGFDHAKDKLFKTLRTNQPKGASFGSIFKNPQGKFAGELIEAVGLKGFSKNDAMLSPKHANFLINKKNASYEDAIFLIELARKRVFQSYGIELENEVIIF